MSDVPKLMPKLPAEGIAMGNETERRQEVESSARKLLVAGGAKKLLAAGVAGMLLATAAAACGDSPPSRQDVLGDLADEVIIPAYDNFLNASSSLAEAVSDLCAFLASSEGVSERAGGATGTDGEVGMSEEAGTANSDAANSNTSAEGALNSVYGALEASRAYWSFSEAMWVGPVMERRSRAVIDWDIDAEQIEARIADTSFAMTADNLATRVGADERGLSAVEYVVGSPSAPEAAVAKLANPRYCEYLTAATQVVVAEAELLVSDWTTSFEDGPPYRTVLSDPDGSGVDDIVNASFNLLRKTSDMELRPAANGDLDAVKEGPLGLGVADIAEHLAGIRAVLIGSGANQGSAQEDGPMGLSELLGDDITDRLAARLDAADAAVSAITPPLRAAAADNPSSLNQAYEELKELQMTISTEVVSKLGVALGFSDTDGDSAG